VSAADNGRRGLVALAAQWAAGRPELYAIPSSVPSLHLGETVYHPAGPIREMPEWAAAVLEAIWMRSVQESAERRTAAGRWSRVVPGGAGASVYAEPAGTTAGWLRYPVLVRDPSALRGADARSLGIMPGYERTLAELPLAPGRLVNSGQWPGAVALASRLRTLPSHSLVSSTDVAAIVKLLGRDLEGRS